MTKGWGNMSDLKPVVYHCNFIEKRPMGDICLFKHSDKFPKFKSNKCDGEKNCIFYKVMNFMK